MERVCRFQSDLSEEHQFVTALFDAYGFFRLTRGEDSEPAQEAIRSLTSLELRLAVRRWYQNGAGPLNPVAAEFRLHLSKLAGETL